VRCPAPRPLHAPRALHLLVVGPGGAAHLRQGTGRAVRGDPRLATVGYGDFALRTAGAKLLVMLQQALAVCGAVVLWSAMAASAAAT